MGAQGGARKSSASDPTPDAKPPAPTASRGSLLAALLGASLVLVAIGAFVVSSAFDQSPTVALVGQDQPVNVSARMPDDFSAHNSPTLVRNPRNPGNLAVSSRIDTPVFDCALHVSLDGGARWTQTEIPQPRKGRGKCYNPDVAFSTDGTLYLSFVTLRGPGNVPNEVWLSTSKDGGRTLSFPLRVRGPLAFQVRLAADPVRPGRLYMTWLQANEVGTLKFTTTGNPIAVIRTDNGGATWTKPVRVSSRARARVVTPAPVVGRDGTLYTLYLDVGNDQLDYEGGHEGMGGPPYVGRYSLVLARSRDGGATWSESQVSDRLTSIGRFIVFLAMAPTVAVDRDGRVYAAFHSNVDGAPDVLLWSLEPGANTWQGPTRVNDTKQRDGTAQYLPKLAVAPDGRVDVLYYDRRADKENLRNEASLQSSFDHGKSFTHAVRLSSRPSDSRIGFGAKEGLPDLGSRLALISDDRAALGLWTDTRAGIPATQKQDLAEAAVAVSDPARLSGLAKGVLRVGALVLGLLGLALLGREALKRSGSSGSGGSTGSGDPPVRPARRPPRKSAPEPEPARE